MVAKEEPRFNLVDEAWILARLKSDEVVELSLRDYFKQVYEIDRIQSDNPLTDTAIFWCRARDFCSCILPCRQYRYL